MTIYLKLLICLPSHRPRHPLDPCSFLLTYLGCPDNHGELYLLGSSFFFSFSDAMGLAISAKFCSMLGVRLIHRDWRFT
jgi:hypothetical protein